MLYHQACCSETKVRAAVVYCETFDVNVLFASSMYSMRRARRVCLIATQRHFNEVFDEASLKASQVVFVQLCANSYARVVTTEKRE